MDTDRLAAARQLALWRSMSPADKAQLVASLSRAVEHLARAGIQHRHPGASDRERLLRLAILKLGLELARRAYPDVAALGTP